MKLSLVSLVVVSCCAIATAQHPNSTFASLAINQNSSEVIGEGPTTAEVFTQSDMTVRVRGMPLQPFMMMHGDYEASALDLGTSFQIDLALSSIGVLVDGLGSPSLDVMTDATGNFSQTVAFPGRANQSDFGLDLQVMMGNPVSLFGLSTTGVAQLQVRAGYQELGLGPDDYAEVPFRSGMTFEFYGKSYDRVWVTSNGRVTFRKPLDVSALRAETFNEGPPAIAGMYHDFDPTAASATKISTSQFKVGEEWHFRISYESIQEFYNPGVFFDFDITLMPYGTVQIAISDRLLPPVGFTVVGLTPGGHIPNGFAGQGPGVPTMDLSAAAGTFAYAGDDQAAYERFFDQPFPLIPYPPFDLLDTTLTFYPAHTGGGPIAGYNVN